MDLRRYGRMRMETERGREGISLRPHDIEKTRFSMPPHCIPSHRCCSRCHETKSIEDFCPTGLKGKSSRSYLCRPCHSAYQAELRRAGRLKKRDKTNCREANARWLQGWRQRHRERSRAHSRVSRALSEGKIKREPCVRCGRGDYVVAHHEDYSKPLEVIWLCRWCHNIEHGLVIAKGVAGG